MDDDRAKQHWDEVYGTRPTDQVSWYQASPATSLRLLSTSVPVEAAVLDVGAGASFLVDTLLVAGWGDVTVLDVSGEALVHVRERLAGREGVSFVVTDLLDWQPERVFGAWHDRAVFHFLLTPQAQQQYVALAGKTVEPGGALVLGTFAADGPTRCSGLDTARYDPEALGAMFAGDFELEHTEREQHITPSGDVQPFSWAILRRR